MQNAIKNVFICKILKIIYKEKSVFFKCQIKFEHLDIIISINERSKMTKNMLHQVCLLRES